MGWGGWVANASSVFGTPVWSFPGRPACCRPPITSLILLELLRNPAPAPPAAPYCLLATGCWIPAEGLWEPGRTSDSYVGPSGPGPCRRGAGAPSVWTVDVELLDFQEKEGERELERRREKSGAGAVWTYSSGLCSSGLRLLGVLLGAAGPEQGEVQVCHWFQIRQTVFPVSLVANLLAAPLYPFTSYLCFNQFASQLASCLVLGDQFWRWLATRVRTQLNLYLHCDPTRDDSIANAQKWLFFIIANMRKTQRPES